MVAVLPRRISEVFISRRRATPAIDGGQVYTYGGGGDLCCRALADGAQVWRMNVLQESHTQLQQWGQASCPLVTPTAVYVQAGQGGAVAVAVSKIDGRTIWESEARGSAGMPPRC